MCGSPPKRWDGLDLLRGLVAVAIDEVKYKKGQRYLTVVCDQFTGRVIWAAKGRSKATVALFFDALGDERAQALEFVTCDGAEWIRAVVADRAPDAIVCLDPFHRSSWATKALDEVRRGEWNMLRRSGGAQAAKTVKGLRWLLLRNWENLTASPKSRYRRTRQGQPAHVPGWQLKEELRDILTMAPIAASAALGPVACLGLPIQARPVRQTGPHHPPLPAIHPSHHRMATHQRHLRVQQRLHRPHPHQRPRLPRPPKPSSP